MEVWRPTERNSAGRPAAGADDGRPRKQNDGREYRAGQGCPISVFFSIIKQMIIESRIEIVKTVLFIHLRHVFYSFVNSFGSEC